MTQEEKELLLKDLCARLPYGVICFAPDYEYGDIGKLWCIDPFEDLDPPITVQYPKGNTITKFCSEVKPYLRSMSSITDEEREQYRKFSYYGAAGIRDNDFTEMVAAPSFEKMDYLNSHHFDYRGLIEKGLALKAPEGMYNLKDK